MNPSKFDEVVKNRAQARVEAKVTAFKTTVIEAAAMLWGATRGRYDCYQNPFRHPEVKAVLEQLLKDNPAIGWPSKLWRTEEAQVTKDLLAVMDEMQKALHEKPKGDITCQEEKEAE